MSSFRRIIAPLLLLYAVLLTVNLVVNYRFYKAGGSWIFSISFSFIIATAGWLGYTFLYYPVFRKWSNWKIHPTQDFILTVIGSGVYGVLIMMLAKNALMLMGKGHSRPIYEAIGDLAYAALFSMLLGLIVHGQDFLMRLQQSARDNERMRLELLKSQHEALKAQVQPHFLFNTLNTLAGLIPDEPEVAVQFVQGLSAVFRYSLQHNEETIPLATELKVADSFLFLNQQRFGNRLRLSVHVEPATKQRHIATHTLLTLLENAIKHNEISAENPLQINIRSTDGDTLVVENSYQPKPLSGASLGLGLPNIVDRYKMLTDRPVTIEKSDQFIVTIPLLPA